MSFKLNFNKEELLKKLKENREKHLSIFEEAYEGYKKKVIEILGQRLAAAKEGKKISHHIHMIEPQNQVSDYDRAITMLEMSTDKEITLNEEDFEQYVLDKWHWRNSFLHSNSEYSATAAAVMADG